MPGKDESLINKDLEASKKITGGVSPELTTRLRYMITSVGGDESPSVINSFAQNMLARDSMHLRTEMKKIVKSMGEKCKISIRNIRREANDELKDLLKKKEIAEDEEKKFEKNIQNYTDEHIKIIEDKVATKEKDIMTI